MIGWIILILAVLIVIIVGYLVMQRFSKKQKGYVWIGQGDPFKGQHKFKK